MIRQCWSGDRKCTGPEGSRRKVAELTVDDIWQIADAGIRRLTHGSRWGRLPRARCRRQRWIVTGSLCCPCWGITSQWRSRSSCISRDRPRSYFQVPLTRRAAAFSTCCDLIMSFGAEDKNRVTIVDARCDKGVDQCLYRLNVLRPTNTSQLPKPEEACLADIWNMPVKTKVCLN